MNCLMPFLSIILSLLLAPQSAPSLPHGIVCIDPGHSRKTVGAAGRKAVEYKICWQMAQRLQSVLKAQGITVVLTKKSAEENVSNADRAAIANQAHADLFLRLHCDAGAGSGIATFFPDRQGVFNAMHGPTSAVIEASRDCAKWFHPAMIAALHGGLADRGIRTDAQTAVGKRQGGALAGSIYAQVPVLLVEMCLITNPKDEAFLASEAGQKKLAQAMASGVAAVLDRRKTPQTP